MPDLSPTTNNRLTVLEAAVTHLETRIKFWVVSCLLTNVVALVVAMVPVIYYLGSINEKFTRAVTDLSSQSVSVRQLELWQQRVDSHNEQQRKQQEHDRRN